MSFISFPTDPNTMNRDQLQNDYIESIIDGMDHKTMYQFVYDTMEQNLETCLLYTSPSPRDRQKSRMPSSA